MNVFYLLFGYMSEQIRKETPTQPPPGEAHSRVNVNESRRTIQGEKRI